VTNRKDRPRLVSSLLVFIALVLLCSSASATWKEKVLYSFQGIPDGSQPAGGVVFDKVGNLYGATTGGGSSSCVSFGDCGTVYQLTPPAKKGDPWTEAVLYVFKGNASNDGATPGGSVIIDSSGNLYGTTAYGGTGGCTILGTKMGCGVVYEMTPPQTKGGKWTYTVLYDFQGGKDGIFPWGDLTLDKNGNLYGATQFGGGKGTTCNKYFDGNCGAVFKLSTPKTKGGKWTEKVLHSFAGGTDGANPNGGLVFDSKGGIYGTTFGGGDESGECGTGGCGTAVELKPPTKNRGAWKEKVLYRFHGKDGANPAASVVFGSNGHLYGTASAGANSGSGAVFDLAIRKGGGVPWKETVLHRFTNQNDDSSPAGTILFDSYGNLYGTAMYGGPTGGNVFMMTPPVKRSGVWKFSVLHGFTGPPNDGLRPGSGLVLGKGNVLYGTTQGGGSGACQGGCGTVFKVEP
jgi:hypothetical protein